MNVPVWRKSSRSLGTGQCVETARLDDRVGVRDSKHPGTSPVLSFSQSEWAAFARRVKRS